MHYNVSALTPGKHMAVSELKFSKSKNDNIQRY